MGPVNIQKDSGKSTFRSTLQNFDSSCQILQTSSYKTIGKNNYQVILLKEIYSTLLLLKNLLSLIIIFLRPFYFLFSFFLCFSVFLLLNSGARGENLPPSFEVQLSDL